jgi:predicted neuraminidase
VRYFYCALLLLTVVLSGCAQAPEGAVEEFANTYIDKFRDDNLVGMSNMFHAAVWLNYPRYEAAHRNILKRLGRLKGVGRARILSRNFNLSGNTYDIVFDVGFEKQKAIYGIQVLARNKELYIMKWYVDAGINEEPVHAEDNSSQPPATQDPPYMELIFPMSQLACSHAPSIVELADGRLFATWYAQSPWGSDTAIWGSTKLPGDNRWTAPRIVHDTPGLPDHNPILFIDGDKNLRMCWTVERNLSKMWLFWVLESNQSKLRDIKMRVKVSKDLAKTWEKAEDLDIPPGFMSRTKPLQLSDGRFILPVYSDWNTSSAIVTSVDGGRTWERPSYILFLLGIQPTVIQRSDGSLFALMRSGAWPRRSWQAESFDLGRSWVNHRLSGVKNPGSSLEMVKLADGNVALAFNNSKKERSDFSVALSEDGGKTWPYVKVIEAKRGYFYPSIIQDRRGLIHVVFSYNDQSDIAHFVADEDWLKG